MRLLPVNFSGIMENKTYRVLVVDDNELIRFGLSHVLSQCSSCQSAEAVGTIEEAIESLHQRSADILILKFTLPSVELETFFAMLKDDYPEIRTLVLLEDDEDFWKALNLGADGYVIRYLPAYQINVVIKALGDGLGWIGPMLARYLLKQGGLQKLRTAAVLNPVSGNTLSHLSDREREVLYLLSEAIGGEEIARKLNIRPQTVKLYISNCIKKLGVRDRSQAIAKYLRSVNADDK